MFHSFRCTDIISILTCSKCRGKTARTKKYLNQMLSKIFKDCHTSKKGMTTPVKAVVVSPLSSCLLTTTYSDLCLELHGLQPMSITLSNLYTVVLAYHCTLEGLKERSDVPLILTYNLLPCWTCPHNVTIVCLSVLSCFVI